MTDWLTCLKKSAYGRHIKVRISGDHSTTILRIIFKYFIVTYLFNQTFGSIGQLSCGKFHSKRGEQRVNRLALSRGGNKGARIKFPYNIIRIRN